MRLSTSTEPWPGWLRTVIKSERVEGGLSYGMSLANSDNKERGTTGNHSGWTYWLERMRRIFSSENDEPQGSNFAIDIRDKFKSLYPLEDEEIGGVWYATLQALQPLENSDTELEARFTLSPDRTANAPTDVFAEPLHVPLTIQRDFNQPQSDTAQRLFFFFTFTDLLPVSQNIKLFEESAIARLRNLCEHPPHSTLEFELAAQKKS